MWVICTKIDECPSAICGHLEAHEVDHWCEKGRCSTIGKEVECVSIQEMIESGKATG